MEAATAERVPVVSAPPSANRVQMDEQNALIFLALESRWRMVSFAHHSVPKKKTNDARYSLASHSTHTSAHSGTLTQAGKANVFSPHDFPFIRLGQVLPLASQNDLLLFKTGLFNVAPDASNTDVRR